jgi:hypothetical protein
MNTDNRHREGSRPSASIDLGLALMARWASSQPLRSYTAYEIADWCGCTAKGIYRIEQRALMKLRAIMRARGLVGELCATAPARLPAEAWVPRPGVEIPLKQWLAEEAARQGVSSRAIYMRMRRHPETRPVIRQVSKRTLMVQLQAKLAA